MEGRKHWISFTFKDSLQQNVPCHGDECTIFFNLLAISPVFVHSTENNVTKINKNVTVHKLLRFQSILEKVLTIKKSE